MADLMQQAREVIADWHRQKGCSQQVIDDCLSGAITIPDFYMDLLTSALRAAPEGFVLVPVKPTPEMLAAVGNGADGLKRRIWRGMLAARPQGVKDAR